MTGESKVKSTSELHQPFSEKYRPLRINHFIGLERAKQLLTTFAASPYASAWLFLGPSGVGKTTMGLALADEISAQLHHVPAKSCRLETVEEVCASCYYSPRQPENWKPPRFHLCLIDEADGMSNAAHLPHRRSGWNVECGAEWVFVEVGHDSRSAEHDLCVHCQRDKEFGAAIR